MIVPELGQFALGMALVVALFQALLPWSGLRLGHAGLQACARSAAWTQAALVAASFLALEYAFINNDFTLSYVVENSNTRLPFYYKISAVWGGHEGSLLLWVLVLSLWTAAVALFSRSLPRPLLTRVLAVMGAVSVAFIAFILKTSNPFNHDLPFFPPDGNDLNPLLQDPGLIMHPPMLYMGYVGFSVPFAFAMAGLISGRLDSAWARWSRPWAVVAWCFLTLGIALGSWWSYYVLGWGGWWFWDPVENASFMPWLAGTALLHSLAVTEKRGVFKAWTVLLAILTFALSVLGTFLVRSGVLTSVHAFASDPSRGMFVLGILTLMVGAALVLFAWRAPLLVSESRYLLMSRETFILANNVLLVIACCVVFLGTLFPLVSAALHAGKISVGPPYFNFVFRPLCDALLVFMAAGSLLHWKQQSFAKLWQQLRLPVVAALIALPIVFWAGWHTLVALSLFLILMVAFSILADILRKVAKSKQGAWSGFWRLSRSYRGMQLAHLGFLVALTGIVLTSYYSDEHDLRMQVGERVQVGPYNFEFHDVKAVQGPNYDSQIADFIVRQQDRVVRHMQPEKRVYTVRQQPMAKVALSPGLIRDLYIALGDAVGAKAWAVRIYYKPFVRWIWLGALLMAAGGVLVIRDPRYRLRDRTGAVSE